MLLADSYLGFVADGDPELDSLIGIASFGSENCNAELPAVYMNVTFFWSWVSGAIAGKVVSKIPEPELEDEIRIEIEDMIQPTKAEREPVKETPHVSDTFRIAFGCVSFRLIFSFSTSPSSESDSFHRSRLSFLKSATDVESLHCCSYCDASLVSLGCHTRRNT